MQPELSCVFIFHRGPAGKGWVFTGGIHKSKTQTCFARQVLCLGHLVCTAPKREHHFDQTRVTVVYFEGVGLVLDNGVGQWLLQKVLIFIINILIL